MSSASRVDAGSSTLSGAASISSRIVGSAMNPHFATSAMPLRSSSGDRDARASRSQSTPAGSWNAPTRFLPDAVLMPVLPPTAASTMPSTVVGRFTNLTPRSQLAATNPEMSVVDPPPRPMTTSDRVNPASRARPSSASGHRPSWPLRRPGPRSGGPRGRRQPGRNGAASPARPASADG